MERHLVGRRGPQTLAEGRIALTGLSAVFLFEMLDTSILTVALPTMGRDLHASTAALQAVTGAYAVVYGGLMLALGAVADRYGRRRVMLAGLILLGVASAATALVGTAGQLVAVRVAMGVAAAMTTPLSMALAFRLYEEEALRVRAITLISTVGLVGMAVGPTLGGLVLRVAPWQTLLVANAPIAALAYVGIRAGIPADDPGDRHSDPADLLGAGLGTLTVMLGLVAPTLFVHEGAGSPSPWAAALTAGACAAGFVLRERRARHPLIDPRLVGTPLVSSGLAFKAASGLAVAGLGYLVTLQLQLVWGWSAVEAAIGMLPQVAVLLATGPFIDPFVRRVGIAQAARLGAIATVLGLGVYAGLGTVGYGWVALALVLVAAGMRVVGVVAGVNVLTGLPSTHTSLGAALVDTASQISAGFGIAVTGTTLAALVAGPLTPSGWSAHQASAFDAAVRIGGLALSAVAAALVVYGSVRTGRAGDGRSRAEAASR